MDMIDFMMAQTGISRQQAAVAFDTIVHYLRQHPGEPLHRVVGFLFGQEKDENGQQPNLLN